MLKRERSTPELKIKVKKMKINKIFFKEYLKIVNLPKKTNAALEGRKAGQISLI